MQFRDFWLALVGLIAGFVMTATLQGSLICALIGAVIALQLHRRDQHKRLTAVERELQDLHQQLARGEKRQQAEARSGSGADKPAETPEAKVAFAATSSVPSVSVSPRQGSPEPVVQESPDKPSIPEPKSERVLQQEREEESLTLDQFYLDQQLNKGEAEAASSGSDLQPASPEIPQSPRTPRLSNLLEKGLRAAKVWLTAGNPLLKVGILLLFLGLAFLLRYAAERVTLPIEFRYMGVAAVAIALLAIGWRLRRKNAAYALSLQGAGIAVLYLTVFAALHLHQLLSPGLAFGFLLVVVICATLLAVVQNALALALVSTIGGFAAPLLSATGDQLALFSYYLLLNLGIVAVAWYKAWRPLNLVGFVATFSIGLWWGLKFYNPELWLQTETFLVSFFLLYLLIGLLFAHRKLREESDAPLDAGLTTLMRWAAGRTDYIDATLMFGPPLVGFGMQYAIVSRFEFGPAYSALILGLLYLGLAMLLWRRLGRVRHLMVEVYLALGVIFGTLAVPLALDAQWTSAIWAVEGAGIYWVSLRQRRILSRLFALLLQGGAMVAFLPTLHPAAETLLEGAYLSALMIGVSLLFSHDRLRRWGVMPEAPWEAPLDPLLAVAGLGMLYLIPPLLLPLEPCVAVWAVAGFVTVWAGSYLARGIYHLPGLLVQALGGLGFLSTLSLGIDSVLDGSYLTALVIGVAMLLSHDRLLRQAEHAARWRGYVEALLVVFGFGQLYLLPPLLLSLENSVAVWALAGLATLYAGLRLNRHIYLLPAFAVQLVAGGLFLLQLTPQDPLNGAGVFDTGWRGLFSAMLIGVSLLAGVWMALRDRALSELPAFTTGSSVLVLIGLVLMNLAVLFVLPWQAASGVWAASGLVILWMGLTLRHQVTFFFGLAIQLVGGAVFLQQFVYLPTQGSDAALSPLSGASFWSPVALSLVAFVAGLLLHRYQLRQSEGDAHPALGWVGANMALVWGAGWWAFTLYTQIVGFAPANLWTAYLLLGAALSSLLWSLPVKRLAWPSLGILSLSLAPVGAVILLAVFHTAYHPAANLGWLAWLVLFSLHFWILKRLDGVLPAQFIRPLHLIGIWLLLAVGSLELRYLLMALSEQHNAWRWLGWAAVPSLYLLLVTFARRLPWPFSAYERVYRLLAVLPVAGLMAAWMLAAIVFSDGSAQPLPYLPLMNPLMLSLLLVLYALYSWWWGMNGLLLPKIGRRIPLALTAAALFLILTSEVFRTAHHWLAVPFRLDALLASMPVQAGLSLLWTSMALVAMVLGTRRKERLVWIAGAALIGVVVVKLFLVELSQHGSIERIFSFIGVGALLLVVGYFSPLPPKSEPVMKEETK